MSTISLTLVRGADGSVDTDASVAAAKTLIMKFKAERETENSTIAAAVDAVFTERKGAKFNKPFLVGEVLRKLNVQPENHKSLTDRVNQYVSDNAGDRASGKPYSIGKGKGASMIRWADQPEASPEADKK